jgi:1-deoxy-D-xylulose-5-phosphate synthase
VHCVTAKGAGHAPALADEADRLHTVRPAPVPGATKPGAAPSWTEVFGSELVALGRRDPRLVAITGAMLRPTGLFEFAQEFPDRVFDVGIAEQHAVTSAAGLAIAGMHPVVALYSTFLNRAFDQVLLDVALHRLPVTFALDRSGVTGVDGPSHHGMWDVSMLGQVPGMRVAAPRDARQLRALLAEAVGDDSGPTAVRYPTGRAPRDLPAYGRLGSADVLTPGNGEPDVLLVPVGALAEGTVAAAELLAADGIRANVVDPRWIVPVDPALVLAAARYRLVVTIEDNAVAGGFGDSFARVWRAAGQPATLLTLGLTPGFVSARPRSDIHRLHRLDAEGIAAVVRAHCTSGRARESVAVRRYLR